MHPRGDNSTRQQGDHHIDRQSVVPSSNIDHQHHANRIEAARIGNSAQEYILAAQSSDRNYPLPRISDAATYVKVAKEISDQHDAGLVSDGLYTQTMDLLRHNYDNQPVSRMSEVTHGYTTAHWDQDGARTQQERHHPKQLGDRHVPTSNHSGIPSENTLGASSSRDIGPSTIVDAQLDRHIERIKWIDINDSDMRFNRQQLWQVRVAEHTALSPEQRVESGIHFTYGDKAVYLSKNAYMDLKTRAQSNSFASQIGNILLSEIPKSINQPRNLAASFFNIRSRGTSFNQLGKWAVKIHDMISTDF
jgi:hypothetical protein